jgi:hypothetical protein
LNILFSLVVAVVVVEVAVVALEVIELQQALQEQIQPQKVICQLLLELVIR